MKADIPDLVSDFIARNAPQHLTADLKVLTRLRMPLHDKREFEVQLADMAGKANEAEKIGLQRVGQLFDGANFPILSVENALEKYWGKFDPFRVLLPPVDLPGGPQQRPTACEVYAVSFAPAAADCACRTYRQALREGMEEYQAVVVGHFAGRRAQRTGLCIL